MKYNKHYISLFKRKNVLINIIVSHTDENWLEWANMEEFDNIISFLDREMNVVSLITQHFLGKEDKTEIFIEAI